MNTHNLLNTNLYHAPFGSPLRKYNFTDMNVGFNGKRMDNELSVEGGHLDFGARIYDSRVARFFKTDPIENKFAFQSPYLFASNTPIVAIDENGEYSVWRHFKMTKKALLELGVSREVAKRIAHYSSTYADNPDNVVLQYNRFVIIMGYESFGTGILDYNEEEFGVYDLGDSQSDEDIKMVSIHAMRAWFEDIDEETAIKRALYGGRFKDVNGEYITIVGAMQVIKSLQGKDIEKLSETEQKALGVALHTIQDAVSHKGKRWVDKHKKEAEAIGNENEHPTGKEQGYAAGSGTAYKKTLGVISWLKKNKKTENSTDKSEKE